MIFTEVFHRQKFWQTNQCLPKTKEIVVHLGIQKNSWSKDQELLFTHIEKVFSSWVILWISVKIWLACDVSRGGKILHMWFKARGSTWTLAFAEELLWEFPFKIMI